MVVTSRQYIREVIEKSCLTDAKVSETRLDPGYIKNVTDGIPLERNSENQKLIGNVLYIAVNTRPDISTARKNIGTS